MDNFSERVALTLLTEYSARRTKKQRDSFVSYMVNLLEHMNYKQNVDFVVEESRGILKHKNIVVGNPEKAKIIIGAHYDTSANILLPNWIVPENRLFHFLSVFLKSTFGFLMMIPLFVVSFLVAVAVVGVFPPDIAFLLTLLAGCFLFWLWLRWGGKVNKHNANDNTSGVLSLVKILYLFDEIKIKKGKSMTDDVCVVFFDNEEKGLLGSKFFFKKHKSSVKDKLMINLDCVGCGEYFLFTPSKQAKQNSLYNSFLAFFTKEISNLDKRDTVYLKDFVFAGDGGKVRYSSSDSKSFENSVSVYTLKKNRFGALYTDKIHTNKDLVLDMINIHVLGRIISSFCVDTFLTDC